MSLRPRYGHAAPLYIAAGWPGCLPVPYRAKKSPPEGYTGRTGVYPDDAQVERWRLECSGWNLAQRLPSTVVGLDTDAYGDKSGGASMAQLYAECGERPATWSSTSRGPRQTSRIEFYRVPAGVRWAERNAGPGIDLIHAGHRYALVWPSVHPEGRLYQWYGPDGEVADRVPRVDELTVLPAAWGRRLTRPASPQRSPEPASISLPEVANRYASAALDGAVSDLVVLQPGDRRNTQLNVKAYALGGLVGAGLLDERDVRRALYDAARANGHVAKHGERQTMATIDSGLTRGMARPRTPVGAAR